MVTGCYEHISADHVQDVLILTIESTEICQPEVAEALRRECQRVPGGGRRHVIVDMRGVEFISTVGYGPLINLHQQVAAGGGKLVLCDLSNFVRDVFTTSHMLIDSQRRGAMFYCPSRWSRLLPCWHRSHRRSHSGGVPGRGWQSTRKPNRRTVRICADQGIDPGNRGRDLGQNRISVFCILVAVDGIQQQRGVMRSWRPASECGCRRGRMQRGMDIPDPARRVGSRSGNQPQTESLAQDALGVRSGSGTLQPGGTHGQSQIGRADPAQQLVRILQTPGRLARCQTQMNGHLLLRGSLGQHT